MINDIDDYNGLWANGTSVGAMWDIIKGRFAEQTSLAKLSSELTAGIGEVWASLGSMAFRDSSEFTTYQDTYDILALSTASWAAGSTSGPVLNIGIGLKTLQATIPSAGASASGVVNTGTQTFGGNKTWNGTQTFAAATTFNAAATINSTLTVTDNTTLVNTKIKKASSSTPLIIAAGFGSSVYIEFDDVSDNLLGYLGFASSGSPVYHNGNQSLALWHAGNSNKSTVDWAAKNLTAAGTLGVTGAATLSSTLAVTGAATLSSTLAVTGNITCAADITASGGIAAGGITDLNLY